jgi:hypothetical protein
VDISVFYPRAFCVLYEGSCIFFDQEIMPHTGNDGRRGLGNARHIPSTFNFPLTVIKTQTGSLSLKHCNLASM